MWNSTGQPWLLGVEEELLIVDSSGWPVPAAQQIVHAAASAHVHEELLASMLEVTTPPVHGAHVAAAIRDKRSLARRLARAIGYDIASSATHPLADPASQQLSEGERYQRIAAALPQIRQMLVCGLHVHVCVPDPEAAVRVHQALSAAAPDLIALAASSPFWVGGVSGYTSTRAQLLTELMPRTGPADRHTSFEDWSSHVAQRVRAGEIADATHLWHDVRLAPHYGTVEVRAFDAQRDWRDSAALARLVEQMARLAAAENMVAYNPAAAAERRSQLLAGGKFRPCDLLVRAASELPWPEQERISLMIDGSARRSQLHGGPARDCAQLVNDTTS